jgi:2-polyprenyl-3-methyl-5-hydroxy-6-metoxy-1,4-benzoquinol methylase
MSNRSKVDRLNDILRDNIFQYIKNNRLVDAYYLQIVSDGVRKVIGPNEEAIGQFLLHRFDKTTKVCEPGTGYGQLAIYLASIGYSVVAFEGDYRYAAIDRIVKNVAKEIELANLKFINGWFPDAAQNLSYDLIVCTNVVNSWWENNGKTLANVLQGHDAIIDISTWWKSRNTNEQNKLLEEADINGYDVEKINESLVYLKVRK